MVQIIHRLYVGNQEDGEKALDLGFVVVSMCKEGPMGHRSILKYTTVGAPKDDDYYYYVITGRHFAANLIDVDDVNFIPEEVINPALEFIKKHYEKGEKVLIHCEQGLSRGPTTTMMFLRSIGEMPYRFSTSFKIFNTLYPKYLPGLGMLNYARNHWNELGKNYDAC